MAPQCENGLDQVLLSGFLDGELYQAEEQRVRIHLEDCASCRQTLEELAEMREAAMTTRFVAPSDEQWKEIPRGRTSRFMRGMGWLFVVAWALAVGCFAVYALLTGPEGFWQKLLVFGGIGGFALLFLSVLLDRMHDARTDRYRRVDR